MGPLAALITSPGGLASIRAVWLDAYPTWPVYRDGVRALEVPADPLPLIDPVLEEVTGAAYLYRVRARVELPVTRPGHKAWDQLGGLVLIGPDDDVLASVPFETPIHRVDPATGVSLIWIVGEQQ
jgi:hypothetical protein